MSIASAVRRSAVGGALDRIERIVVLACGSTKKLNSASEVVLPSARSAAPMMIASRTAWTIRGSFRMARATLVSGATATSVTSPGCAMISRMIISTACSFDAPAGEAGRRA